MGHLLEVHELETEFRKDDSFLKAVNKVSYTLEEGEIVAFVGESGSGKSVTQYSGLQLIEMPPGRIAGGQVLFEGEDLLKHKQNSKEIRSVRGGKIGVVFQEPMTSLNPVMTVGRQIEESVMLHLNMNRKQARQRAIELLTQVGIPDAESRVDDYPHQFSGGMRQRIMIAMAMSCNPKILIADEATTALDVTTQAQILELLRDMVKKTGTSLVLVTHNLGIVARYADRIYVMYAGEIVESGTCRDIFNNPRHPYTIGLLRAVPSLSDPKERRLVPIEGVTPDLRYRTGVCAFAPRCMYATEACFTEPSPKLRDVPGEDRHQTACHRDVDKSTVPVKQTVEAVRKLKDPRELVRQDVILEIRDLKVSYPILKGILRRKAGELAAVDGVSFKIHRGETFGLVGESGCGKSTLARTVMGLIEPTAGSILFRGNEWHQMPEKQKRSLRRDITMIFQDPYGSLDPRQRAGDIVGEPLRNFKLVKSEKEYQERVSELFRLVGLDPSLQNRMPHEFSGGQRQRLGIARAIATNPAFIVCDEAISALDVSIQAQIINLLEDLQEELGLTYLFIAHDLTVVRHISDRIAVMYLGQIVEIADWKSLYDNPLHPYTQALLEAVPIPDPEREAKRERKLISGEVPSLINRPVGCAFSNRCPLATDECRQGVPRLRPVRESHSVACFKVDAP
ncbi:oligopeptide/dipeptide ABC transporter, ATP-binding protein [Thermobacillus composti KWC4]|uniref:Oligopeptide/dipeptide ABC transporter, ATP-binding protein n=1 Tax=Thermobacillus composti (strain DSM 18247 / JCM 13945 / KWC4) TaxID=717605 RepID=L0EAC0_THECK|nr:ABC transporter ATP-binding protein [Thermobacillus composti]AGA56641.1 oligopeptide/dipeptide ABC transporter, ATP-binding protein [Thermobacillus composti KWC4]